MKALVCLFLLATSVLIAYSCSPCKYVVTDPTIGKIEVEIWVETGKDSLARTPDGNVIGRIDKKGSIYDLSGNKIGQRKLTAEELIRQAGY